MTDEGKNPDNPTPTTETVTKDTTIAETRIVPPTPGFQTVKINTTVKEKTSLQPPDNTKSAERSTEITSVQKTSTCPTPEGQKTIIETTTSEKTITSHNSVTPPPGKTRLLTPMMGVRLAWTLTSALPKTRTSSDQDLSSTIETGSLEFNAADAGRMLEKILAAAENDPGEKAYVLNCIAAIRATVRNLSTAYRARELNFNENSQLRQAYIDSITDDVKFGTDIRDYAKTLPSIIIGGGTGLGISGILKLLGYSFSVLDLFLFAVIFAVASFFADWGLRKWSVKRKIRQFIWRDYERSIYYRHYLDRSKTELITLYRELVAIDKHNDDGNAVTVAEMDRGITEIKKLLLSNYPVICDDIETCIFHWRFDTTHWKTCETRGKPTTEDLPGEKYRYECPGKPEGPPRKWLTEHGITYPMLLGIIGLMILLGLLVAYISFAVSVPASAISLTKTVNSSPLYQNQTAEVMVTFGNRGSTGVTNLTITDKKPDDFTLMGGTITRTIASLKTGESRSVRYLIQSNEPGNYVLDPAEAQFTSGDGTIVTIQSDSPSLEILPGPPQETNLSSLAPLFRTNAT